MATTPFNDAETGESPHEPVTQYLALAISLALCGRSSHLNETHTFSPNVVNEARLGFNRFSSSINAECATQSGRFRDSQRNQPADRITPNQRRRRALSILVDLRPNRRDEAIPTFVVADTVSWLHGLHSLKFGGEYRQFLNNNFRQGTGSFNFATVAAFLAGTQTLSV